MELQELPDLSDWRYVEVWTLEEAAMLWAAIDPADHIGKRLAELRGRTNPKQYKKAVIYLRAAKEAVCSGTLPFTDAWEDYMDEQGNCWTNKVEFPNLPEPIRISAEMTRVKQAAFLKWAQSKNIPSYRQSLAQAAKARTHTTVAAEVVHPEPEVPLLGKPSFLDPSHPYHPVELRAGVEVWEAVVTTGAHEGAKSVKDALMSALEAHPEHSKLSNEAKSRITVSANWNKKGGATKTPSKGNPPTPSE
ncbi:hypothetical protein [Delftia tsuruhatensis]|jgi:hypothetical protein|uniref:hypothetical protein n=1 Tax=Delftia tsuruhatensis TaxID=180282 RepID=UPI0031DBB2A1